MTERPETVAEWSAIFRERFADIAALIESNGATWTISSAGDRAASPVPGQATVVVRPKDDRGFGFQLAESHLEGMRGCRYDISDLVSPEVNQAFANELLRRIRAPGLTRHDVLSGDHSLAHWKHFHRPPLKRTATWNPSAY